MTAAAVLIFGEIRVELRESAPYWTADVAVACWAIGAATLLRLRGGAWETRPNRVRVARAVWACGAVALAVHVAVAFEVAHGWSIAAAYAATEAAAGVGAGVYVNFAVVAVWAADAAWLAGFPAGYARRPRWVGVGVHGFLAFVVFNAVVVFAAGPTRVAGIVAFVALAGLFAKRPPPEVPRGTPGGAGPSSRQDQSAGVTPGRP